MNVVNTLVRPCRIGTQPVGPTFLSFFLSVFLSLFLSFFLSLFLSLFLSVFLSFLLSVFLFLSFLISFFLSFFLLSLSTSKVLDVVCSVQHFSTGSMQGWESNLVTKDFSPQL